ncbi:hypothetical protein [Winogradskyella jejuensis]|uniref:Uncharacterized protein n=1 Tax=Winogradskyella jejuensis TaxID=1089305 RepID=A0A1M5UCH6_9FLAO|nr:hypothetical protein [Winogradskyella jejuensis]SHH60734.1 hypothetical protein SAMN05444148_2437 [Winogradskyella jejuensis]
MKSYYLIIPIFLSLCVTAQEVDLSQFTLANTSSPAFVLVEETPTAIYMPENLKALAIHALDNFGESLSVELAPHFLINQNRKDRTYQQYIGVMVDPDTKELKQNPFSGLNTTTLSLAYVNKDFSGLADERKTYSLGLRTTLLRFYNKEKVHANTIGMATALSNIKVPSEVLIQGEEAIQEYYNSNQDEINALIQPFQKTIKPLFRLDAAAGYSVLFKENKIDSGTASRFGSWLTAETSIILNENNEAKTNNYFNLFLTGRYIEDGFNATGTDFFTNYYRDFGGKVEFEFGRVGFAYEYISRDGTISSERSVGSINFTITKDITINGGFGKDFAVTEDNLITIFGIHWGLNTGNSKVKLN